VGIVVLAITQGRPFREFISFISVTIFLLGFGYVIFKKFVFCLVDSVWEDGEQLIVRNGPVEERIGLGNITNINYIGFITPPRVTLRLAEASSFGTEISFAPPLRLFHSFTHPTVTELMERVEVAHSKS
jgi:hypothetical protein